MGPTFIACVMVCRVQTQVFPVILNYPLDKNSNKARPQPPRISGLTFGSCLVLDRPWAEPPPAARKPTADGFPLIFYLLKVAGAKGQAGMF